MNGILYGHDTATEVADALSFELSPVCNRLSRVGQTPLDSPRVSEIRFLAIPKIETFANFGTTASPSVDRLHEKMQLLQNQDAIVHEAKERYWFNREGVPYPFQLSISTEEAWFARLVQASSGRDLYITLATAAKNMGMKWSPSRGGFEDSKTGKMTFPKSEEEVFEIARLPYMPLARRNEVPVFTMAKSGLPPILTKQELREWAASVPWTDTTCGGEFHQYSFRTAGDERKFVHIAECIREFGYDGMYLRKKWRYLDLDGLFYFTCGATIETTTLINRKRLLQPETPWTKNPHPWIPLK
jgi:hypothetical protein